MASRNRDLTIGLATDLNRFDLKDAENQLDDLGDGAKKAGRAVEDGLERGEKGMRDLGDTADRTRADLNAFMDKLGNDAKKAGREVDAGMDKASKGLDEFKEESASTGREAAASFSGSFEDVADTIQEVAANAFVGFGPAGAAAGLAAAAGIGYVVTQVNEAKERVKELTQSLFDMATSGASAFDRQREALSRLAEQGELGNYRDAVRNIGASWRDFVAAMTGDEKALERVKRQADDAANRWGGLGTAWDDASKGGQVLSRVLSEQSRAIQGSEKDVAAYNEGLTKTEEAVEGAERATQSYVDNAVKYANEHIQEQERRLSGVEGALQRVAGESTSTADVVQEKAQKMADATKEPGDSWADFADDVKLSASDIVKTLDEQTAAMVNYQKNLAVVAERGSAEFLEWVQEQPKQVAQAYAEGTAKQRQAIFDAWARNVGAAQGEGVVAGLDAKANALRSAGARARAKVQEGAGESVVVQVGVTGPTAAQVDAVKRQIFNRFGTLTIPTNVAYGAGRNIP